MGLFFPSCTVNELCDLEQFTSPLWASISYLQNEQLRLGDLWNPLQFSYVVVRSRMSTWHGNAVKYNKNAYKTLVLCDPQKTGRKDQIALAFRRLLWHGGQRPWENSNFSDSSIRSREGKPVVLLVFSFLGKCLGWL